MSLNPAAYDRLADMARPREKQPIGEMAIEEGLITPAQLQECLREQEQFKGDEIPRDVPRLGEILVSKGFLTPERLAELLERQADEAGLREPSWRYGIRDLVARGATGLVYRAWDRELRREVALKVIRREHVENPEVIARALQEARAAARLSHPNIVTVYDVGQRQDLLYIVMKMIEGKTLSDSLRDGDLRLRDKIELLAAVAEGVDHAHRQGVIHRDIKPRNIMVDPDGRPAIMDFGLARLAGADSVQTRTGVVVGTPLYMSPEQVRGDTHNIDHRTDIYALGVILYEMLTGKPPHTGESTATVYNAILNRDPVTPRKRLPSVPRDLEIICMKAIEKEARARFATAGQMAEDLRRYLRGEPIKARPATVLYRTMKFVRRYPIQIALLASSTTLTLAAIILSGTLLTERPGDGRTVIVDNEREESDRLWLSTLWAETVSLQADIRTGRLPTVESRKRLRQMLREINALSARAPSSEVFYVRANVRLLNSDPDGADRDIEASIRLGSTASPAWRLKAVLQSERFHRRLLGRPPPLKLPEDLHIALQRARDSSIPRRRLRHTTQDEVLNVLSRALHAKWISRDTSQATLVLQQALRSYRSEEYLNLLGRWAPNSARNADLQNQALALAPHYLPALIDRASARAALDQPSQAEADLNQALALQPDNASVWAERGLLHKKQKDAPKAIADLERALKLDPTLQPVLAPLLEELRKNP